MSAAPPTPFWTFSLSVYAKPGVAEACLELQDVAGVDVNVLLYLLWQSTRRRRLRRAELDAVVALVDVWRREIVAPLREARRASKEAPEGFHAGAVIALRQQIKRAELEAERVQQEALYAWRATAVIGENDEPVAAARSNLTFYAEALAARFPEASEALIVSAALASATPQGKTTS